MRFLCFLIITSGKKHQKIIGEGTEKSEETVLFETSEMIILIATLL